MKRVAVALGIFVALLGAPLHAQDPPASIEGKGNTQRNALDEEAVAQLVMARKLIDAGKASDALGLIDRAIALFKQAHPANGKRLYAARDSRESLAYLVMAAAQTDVGRGQDAVVRLTHWPVAYQMKGYALVELGRHDEAIAALREGIALRPYDSGALSELGSIYQSRKDWTQALELYREADAASAFSEDEVKMLHATRAKRGIAFVMIEQDQLENAESVLVEALQLDPGDTKSRNELEYIRGLREKRKD